MSWNAYLSLTSDASDESVCIADWNYTHNCNDMIARVLDVLGRESRPAWWDGDRPPTAWWHHLDGLSGADGAHLLDQIVGGLLEAPDLFRKMNPDNGWGDYDSLLAVLVEMRDRSRAWPAADWSVNG